jgi:hypothetical protein
MRRMRSTKVSFFSSFLWSGLVAGDDGSPVPGIRWSIPSGQVGRSKADAKDAIDQGAVSAIHQEHQERDEGSNRVLRLPNSFFSSFLWSGLVAGDDGSPVPGIRWSIPSGCRGGYGIAFCRCGGILIAVADSTCSLWEER